MKAVKFTLANHTSYKTTDLRAMVCRVIRDLPDAQQRRFSGISVTVCAIPNHWKDHVGWLYFLLPVSANPFEFSRAQLARHIAGWAYGSFTNVPRPEYYATMLRDYPLRLTMPKAPLSKTERHKRRVALKLTVARVRVKQWRRKTKLAETKLALWTKRLAALEKKLAMFAAAETIPDQAAS